MSKKHRENKGISVNRPVVVRAADNQNPTAKRTFSLVAYTGEPMDIYPFDLPVVVDISTLDLSCQNVPALYDHCPNIDHVVGQITSLEIVGGELVASGVFTIHEGATKAIEVLAKADAGYHWQASIGGNPKHLDELKAGEKLTMNDRIYEGPLLVARGVAIREVSFVVLGGDRKTSAVVAKNKAKKSKNNQSRIRAKGKIMSFEEWLLSLGFADASDLDPVQTANLQQLYNDTVESPSDEEPTEPITGEEEKKEDEVVVANVDEEEIPVASRSKKSIIAARLKAEAEAELKIAKIRKIAASYNNPEIEIVEGGVKKKVPLVAHALAHGWDENRTELAALRNDRNSVPGAIIRGRGNDCTIEALQGAMILRAGGRLDSKAYQSSHAVAMGLPGWLRAGINAEQKQKALEFAHKFASMSMVDLCREACRIDGIEASYDRREMIKAAFSGGGSLSNVFTTNVNAILLAEYLESLDSTLGWVTEADVNDFKTNERPRVELGSGLAKLPRNGEADHATFSDKVESYKISRYAKQFQIDEQDIIDDNFSVFADTPKRLGLAAARLRPDLVYGLLMSNPTLTSTAREAFNATDGNLLTGAALTAAKLKAAISAMMLFRENSVNLNLMPTHLIVPPTLWWTAKELMNSTTIVSGNTAERGSANVVADAQLTIITDPRLENGVVYPADGTSQSGSSSTWYIASTYAHTIEVGYLSGTGRAPSVRATPLTMGKWGMNWDVNLDIGVKILDWKGMVKNTA